LFITILKEKKTDFVLNIFSNTLLRSFEFLDRYLYEIFTVKCWLAENINNIGSISKMRNVCR